jgi:drug/metabolite transporter (DMT)-like permease
MRAHAPTLAARWKLIACLGFLGMWICGGIVYVALQYTTATHGTLIYTASPVIVVLLGALMARRALPLGQAVGVVLGIAGVFTIVLEGQPTAILSHHFNAGDLWFVLAAISWAIYSLLLKNAALQTVPTFALFFVIALAGAVLLIPCMIAEWWLIGGFPSTLRAWASIAGIVIFASVLSYSTYQYGVKRAGPALTSIFLYLLPVYGIAMAVLFLGETVRLYHAVGLVLVLGGIVLATAPSLPKRRKA